MNTHTLAATLAHPLPCSHEELQALLMPAGHRYAVVSFDQGQSYRVTVDGQLQRPEFSSHGAAAAFGSAVARGTRNPEPAR